MHNPHLVAWKGKSAMLSLLETVLAMGLGALLLSANLKINSDSLRRLNLIAQQQAKAEAISSWKFSEMAAAHCATLVSPLMQTFLLCSKEQDQKRLFLRQD